MGLSSCFDDHARRCHGPSCGHDRGKAQTRLCRGIANGLIAACLLIWAQAACADRLRIATLNADLSRNGPGLLLRDIRKGEDDQIAALSGIIAHIAPDILLLTDIDYDFGLAALTAFRDRVAENGVGYPYLFALPSNRGLATDLDLDGDGKRGGPGDAQGYGAYFGQGAMALLSRYPIDISNVRDFSDLLWVDLPGATLPRRDGAPFPSAEAQAIQRLSSTGHWVVPVLPDNAPPLTLMAFHATTPVFDGPEDRNGLRNADELRFWRLFLNGVFGPPPNQRFVLIGDANLDPADSEGRRAAIRALLGDPRLQDPRPVSPGGIAAADLSHRGDPATDTADWPGPVPGNLRIDYVLPSADWRVLRSGVFWPAPGSPQADLLSVNDTQASRHRMVWVDLVWP